MPVGSGLGGQFGWGVESTAGTPVTVTKFAEVETEDFKFEITSQQGEGLRAGGTAPLASRRVQTTKTVSGSVEMPFYNRGLGTLLKAAMGSSATSTLVLGSAYQQVHQPGDQQSAGSSLTVQVGRPNVAGTVTPFTYNGCKITGFEISGTVDDLLKLKVDFDGWNEATATALATASFPAVYPMHGAQMAVSLGGTVSTATSTMSVAGGAALSGVKGFTISASNPLKTDRFYANSSGVKAEQILNGWREYAIELDMDYIDRTTLYDSYVSGAAQVLKITFEGSIISGSDKDTVEIILPAIKWDEASLNLDGADVVPQKIKGRILDDGSNGFFQLRYKNADATI